MPEAKLEKLTKTFLADGLGELISSWPHRLIAMRKGDPSLTKARKLSHVYITGRGDTKALVARVKDKHMEFMRTKKHPDAIIVCPRTETEYDVMVVELKTTAGTSNRIEAEGQGRNGVLFAKCILKGFCGPTIKFNYFINCMYLRPPTSTAAAKMLSYGKQLPIELADSNESVPLSYLRVPGNRRVSINRLLKRCRGSSMP